MIKNAKIVFRSAAALPTLISFHRQLISSKLQYTLVAHDL
jgi:hypothetical protein